MATASVTPLRTPAELQAKAEKLGRERAAGPAVDIRVSLGTCGLAAGTTPVLEALRQAAGGDRKISVTPVGCMGLCHSEPSIEVVDCKTGKSVIYGNVKPEQAAAIVASGASPASGVEALPCDWYYPECEAEARGRKQARIVLRNCGRIDPEKIEDYLAEGGYQALAKALTSLTPKQVVDEIIASGLRGRGGGGFPTGKKWAFAAVQQNAEKYVVCNADEGDPGAFMDRAVLEGDPHSVLEAMAIAGYAIGAHRGVIYIRAEYPLAVKRLWLAIDQARACGLLGKDLFGSGFDFEIDIKYGAGAFVCGEETALLHSIEGKRGEPTFKPPFPAIAGLWKKPTVVNNVETYANVCAILRKGAEWFKRIGTAGSPGTKVFSLTGKINRVGLIEVAMGVRLRDIIFEIGGGIKNGRRFKAVQTGGPSGGCLRDEHLDTAIDYESLKTHGSMMGSGGMIVMDEDDCMVNIARFFLEFTLDESCGKCTPCRIGNKRLHEMLEQVCEGKATLETIEKLRSLSAVIKDTALCGLGQTSPNPVLATLRFFEDEYLAHVRDRKCPAHSCQKLAAFVINEKCVGCGACARVCPVACIRGERKKRHEIDAAKCIRCGSCVTACKFAAVEKQF